MTDTTDNLLARLKEVACHRARGISIHIDLETWGKKSCFDIGLETLQEKAKENDDRG